MAITKEKKKELVSQHQQNKKDTGSPEVQISILTERIKELSGHLTKNSKDYASQLGLLKMVGNRKSLLAYLKRKNLESYRKLTDQLAIR